MHNAVRLRLCGRLNSALRGVVLVARAGRAALEEPAGDTGEDGEAEDDYASNDHAGQCAWVDLAAVVDALSAADLCR